MKNRFSYTTLIFGYAFLYIPLAVLIFFSFNAGKSVFIWQGFSLTWYRTLFQNQDLLQAAWASLRIATACATLSTLLGLCSALALHKFRHFPGRSFFNLLLKAPLMMPEVLMGLSFLILFMALEHTLGWPELGTLSTLTVAHTTLALSYVSSVIYTQLQDFDRSLTEAAMVLGASPFKAFLSITLPILSPSLASGWLLAFALSLDDLVIASFVSGPQSTTLPLYIYSSIRYGLTPQVNALAALIILVITLGLFATRWRRKTS